jgi:arsenate reductase (thioredoxin)
MKILFMCIANSARSQLAEGIARKILPPEVDVRSAGSKPFSVSPYAIQALKEIGIDISQAKSKGLEDFEEDYINSIDYVITLCAEEVCPVVITKAKKLHWPFPDPTATKGGDEEKLKAFRLTRDKISARIRDFAKRELQLI